MSALAAGAAADAVAVLGRAAALPGATGQMTFNLASALAAAGERAQAVAAWHRALAARPARAGDWSNLVEILIADGDLDALAAHLGAYLGARAAHGFFWKEPYYPVLKGADRLIAAGDRAGAARVLARAIAVADPHDRLLADWFRFLLGSLHLRFGDPQTAAAQLRAAARGVAFLRHIRLGDAFAERIAAVAGDPLRRYDAAFTMHTDAPPGSGVVACACDAVYLRRFGHLFAAAIDAFATPECVIHFHVVAPDAETASQIAAVEAGLTHCRVGWSTEPLPVPLGPQDLRTFYTCVRFLRLPDLIAAYRRPIVVADIDAVFLGDPLAMPALLDEARPLALLFSPTTLAYLYDAVGGGLVAALPFPAVETVFADIKRFLLSWLIEGRMAYFLDQVALGLGVGVPAWPDLRVGVRPFALAGGEASLGGTGFLQIRSDKAAADFDARAARLVAQLGTARRQDGASQEGMGWMLRSFAGRVVG